jgi:hypothetical protein
MSTVIAPAPAPIRDGTPGCDLDERREPVGFSGDRERKEECGGRPTAPSEAARRAERREPSVDAGEKEML